MSTADQEPMFAPAGDASGLLVFLVAEQRHAVPATAVRCVLPALSLAPLPGAPACVAGVINLRGELVPVLDVRVCLGLPSQPMAHDDHLIVIEAGPCALALHVEKALEIVGVEGGAVHGGGAVARLAAGLVFVHDPRTLLRPTELAALAALCRSGAGS